MYEMNNIFPFFVPVIFILSFAYAIFKKVRVYDSFAEGIQGAIPLILSIFPYIAAVTMLAKLLDVSGLGNAISGWLTPLFSFTGVPTELASLVLVKPLSGSGSIAVLTEILETQGVDSYIGRCACVIYGSSETIFYIGAVYFAGLKRKKLNAAMAIALVSFLLSVVLACFLCKLM